MTISEKLRRIKAIPKRINEINRDRNRLLSPKITGFENSGASHSTGGNGAEKAMLDYADIGAEIDDLIRERERLIAEVQDEINGALAGEETRDIDRREVVKSRLIDGNSLKYIANKVVHINYTDTKELFREGCARLGL